MTTQSERPDEQPGDETSASGPQSSEAAAQSSPTSQPGIQSTSSDYEPQFIQGALFPHEVPSEHWDADFSDSQQVYQGSMLPMWILAGWAIFIIWALVYLYFGLTEF